MLKNVAVVGSMFTGWCSGCEEQVTGYMVEGAFVTIHGKNICVVGSRGVGSCGHDTYVAAGSEVFTIHDKPVARVGDPVAGMINGELIEGEFVLSD